MPAKGGQRTTKEALFTVAYARTEDREYAATAAGMSRANSFRALQRPELQADVRKIQMKRLNDTLLPLALDVVQAVLSDENESARNRLTAAKIVIDRTTGPENASEAKEPHEMTAAELQERIDRLRREASDRATKVIDAEPVSAAKQDGKGAFE